MGLDLSKMREIKRKQRSYRDAMEAARECINKTIDEFDEAVRDCQYYEPAVCHGENDPECSHPDCKVKWCEVEWCPLLK